MRGRGSLSSCSSGTLSALSWVNSGSGSELASVSLSSSASGKPQERCPSREGHGSVLGSISCRACPPQLSHHGLGHSFSFPEVETSPNLLCGLVGPSSPQSPEAHIPPLSSPYFMLSSFLSFFLKFFQKFSPFSWCPKGKQISFQLLFIACIIGDLFPSREVICVHRGKTFKIQKI